MTACLPRSASFLPSDHPGAIADIAALTGLAILAVPRSRDLMVANLQARRPQLILRRCSSSVWKASPSPARSASSPSGPTRATARGWSRWSMRSSCRLCRRRRRRRRGGRPYVIGDQNEGAPGRLRLGNEYSDHVMERRNHLYLCPFQASPILLRAEVLIGGAARRGEGDGPHRAERSYGSRASCFPGKPTCATRSPIPSSTISSMLLSRRPGDVHIYYSRARSAQRRLRDRAG